MGNLAHNPIPSVGSQTASTIEVQYYKQYANAYLDEVDVYNGRTLVTRFTTIPPGAAGWNIFSLPLGSFISFPYGIGVSMHFTTAPGLSTEFIIGEVGAYEN